MEFKKVLLILTLSTTAEEYLRTSRKKEQKKKEKLVNNSMPTPVNKNQSVNNEEIQITIVNEDDVNWASYQESEMSESEIDNWKSLISTFAGETTKTGLELNALKGVLKCDIPIKELCRIKDNPETMRGFVIKNGKISQQAVFSEVQVSEFAPLLVYQFLAAVTSQHYQQVITENLYTIKTKLNNIFNILSSDDKAKLEVYYDRFKELSQKTKYDIADKQIASVFSNTIDTIRRKYRKLLSNINSQSFRIQYQWSDKKEAEKKIQALKDSNYFLYLNIVMHTEVLNFIASAILIKIAKYLGNDEDVKIYLSRINIDYWPQIRNYHPMHD